MTGGAVNGDTGGGGVPDAAADSPTRRHVPVEYNEVDRLARDEELAIQAAVDRSGVSDGRALLDCATARERDLVGEGSAWIRCCFGCHQEWRPDRPGLVVTVDDLTLCCAWDAAVSRG